MLSLDPPNNVHIPYALMHFFHPPLKSLKAFYFVDDGKPIIRGMFLILDFLPSSAILSLPLSLLNLWQGICGDISLKRLGEAKLVVIGLFNHFAVGCVNIPRPQSLYIPCILNFLAQFVKIYGNSVKMGFIRQAWVVLKNFQHHFNNCHFQNSVQQRVRSSRYIFYVAL